LILLASALLVSGCVVIAYFSVSKAARDGAFSGVKTPTELTPVATAPRAQEVTWVTNHTQTAALDVAWAMPEPDQLEGPRPMASLDATATYWIHGNGTGLRHDVAVIERHNAVAGEPKVDATLVMDAVQPGTIMTDAIVMADGTSWVNFGGLFDNRMYIGTVILSGTDAIVVSVGYLDEADLSRAADDLLAMTEQLSVTPR
jgi:hypothetical protein